MARIFIVTFVISVLVSVAGCSSGTPMETATAFAKAICDNDLDTANKLVVFEDRAGSSYIESLERDISSIFQGVPGGSSIMMHLYNNSTFDLIENTPATARVVWKADMGGMVRDLVAALGSKWRTVPESGMPGEYGIFTMVMEKRGGKWRIIELVEAHRY